METDLEEDEFDYSILEDATFTYNDIEYPLLYDNGIGFFADVDGATVRMAYKLSGTSSWTYVENWPTSFGSQEYDFVFEILLPKGISKDTTFNYSIKGTYDGIISFREKTITFVRGKSGYYDGSFSDSSMHFQADTYPKNFKFISDEDVTAYCDVDRIFIGFNNTSVTNAPKLFLTDISIQEKSSSGLLSGIVGWVKNIYNGLTELPGKIASSIKGFFDNVVNAVVNLGNFIIDGIKGLFVPTQDEITAMQDKWNTLLEDRFGALYQAIDIIHDYAAAFTSTNKSTIDMPKVSVPVAGSQFEFGGQTVQVVPDGFGIIIDALKLMISIISTFAFVNAMKNRLEKLVGGASNI